MPSSPSTRLRAELQAAGENLNTWGAPKLNSALQRLEEAIAGRVPLSISGAYTLDSENYVADEARNAFLDVTGGTGGTITIPAVEKLYLLRNNASGDITVTTGGGSSAAIKSGELRWIVSDGTNVYLGKVLDMSGSQLHNVADPSSPQDAATKAYVDAASFAATSGLLPGQSGNAGKFLTTDGSSPSWASPLPSQTGHGNAVLGTNGTTASWVAALLASNNLGDLTNVTAAQANLGLGSLALLNTVNNANWSGSALSVANGGTGGTSQATARTGLGLGTAATQNTGTAGTNIPLLSGANTWGAKQTFAASTTSAASVNFPSGVAPTVPATGDFYFDGTNLFIRQSGAWSQLALASAAGVSSFNARTGAVTLLKADVTGALTFTPLNAAGDTMGGKLILVTSSASTAALTMPKGTVDPTSPISGDIWNTNDVLKYRTSGGATKTFAFLDSALTGNTSGNAGTATALQNSRNFSATGNVTASAVAFNGTADVALNLTIGAGVVANSMLANMAQATIKGRASGAGTGAPTDLTPAQVRAIALPAVGSANQSIVVNAGATDYALGGPPFAAWGKCSVSGGVVTLNNSYNVSSVTRTGTGKFTVVMTNALVDANYAPGGLAQFANTVAGPGIGLDTLVTMTTTNFGLYTVNGGGIHDPDGFTFFVVR